jgi:hypothetical protein
MAIGDLDGDLASTYEAQRKRQPSYDLASLPVGPVGRASQQLSTLPAQAPVIPPAAFGGAVAPVTPQPPSLGSLPVTSPANPFRSTGIGGGAAGGNIVARTGVDGVPEFTNASGAQQQAASLSSISAAPRSRSLDASANSLASIGDGQGIFSQSQAGDAALAGQRFSRAADIRQDTRNQQRLDRALANQASLNNLTVVRDSSRPITRDDLIRDEQDMAQRQAGLDQVGLAQGVIAGTQGQRMGDMQLRQASRLEDIQARAYSPGATQADRDALIAAQDPTGEKRANVSLAAARAEQARAAAAKDNAEATGVSPAAKERSQLNQLEIAKRTSEATTSAQTAQTQREGSIDIARRARDLAQAIPSNPSFNSITGTVDSMTPTLVGSSQDLVNQASQLQTLLTADNLKLMTGVLTDKDIAFLTQIGSGLNVTKNGINGSEAGARKTLSDITGRLTQKIDDYEKGGTARTGQAVIAAPGSPAAPQASSGTQSAPATTSGGPSIGQVVQGYQFQGGDPSVPGSWRRI